MKRFLKSNIIIILFSVVIGILLGEVVNEAIIKSVVLVVKQISGQIIFFLVPLIIFSFVSSSITNLRSNVTRLLIFAFVIAYLSSVVSAFFSMAVSRGVVPLLHIEPVSGVTSLPKPLFTLEITPLMSVISSLLFAILVGISSIWVQSDLVPRLLQDFQKMVLQIVRKVLLPILPVYIAMNFCVMSYQGQISKFSIFLPALLFVVLAHYIWLTILYLISSVYSKENGWKILRHYGPAYFTALGTMSSAATLATALECAEKSGVLKKNVVGFTIPLFANIHLSGAMITETFFLSVVSVLLYGHLPDPITFSLFIFLLGIFAVGAPGVPAGTAFASIGIITSLLGFDDNGIALFLTLFALQDSFGTGCNIVGDGALSLIVQTYQNHIQNKK